MGPVLHCRLNTAVLWEWDPITRRRWGLSRLGAVGLLAGAVAVVAAVRQGGAGLPVGLFVSALLLSLVVEAILLVRLTGGAIARTTRALRDSR